MTWIKRFCAAVKVDPRNKEYNLLALMVILNTYLYGVFEVPTYVAWLFHAWLALAVGVLAIRTIEQWDQ